MATFVFTLSTDHPAGQSSQYNFYYFTPATLQAGDTLTGASTAPLADVGVVTASGTIGPTQFAGVSGLEQLRLSGAGDSVTLTDALVAGSSAGYFTVADGAANDFSIVGTADDSGDGKSDLIWRRDDGAIALTTTPSLSALSSINEAVGTNWVSVGLDWHVQAEADVSGDGRADLIWRNDNGSVAVWTLNGTQVLSTEVIASASADWNIVGSADFNADGRSDILWRNDDGSVAVWTLNGTQLLATGVIGSAGNDWHISGTADFNGDGRADILWRNDDGSVAIWTVNGTQLQSAGVVATAGNDWHIIGTADFNGDGRADILWRNDDGTVAIWTVNGSQLLSAGVVAAPGADWHILGTADFNGDGKADILWRNDDGSVAVWTMNGAQILSANVVGTVTSDWHLVSTNDYDGDHKADILWRNDDGSLAEWSMNGGQIASIQALMVNGNDTVNASAVSSEAIHAYVGSGNDTYTGGAGADTVYVESKQITSGDTINGGAGNDTLVMQDTNGTLTASQLQHVTGFEAVTLTDGGTVTLSDGNFGGASLTVNGSSAVDNVDASTVTAAHSVTFNGGGGADTFKGGAGNDQFLIPDSNFVSLQGGAGTDSIVLTQPGQSFDLDANVSKITGVEVIDLRSSAGAVLNLTAADVPLINAVGNSLYVLGGSDDDVTYGPGWALISTTNSNNAVASGVNFSHWQHTTGADLFIQDGVPPPTEITNNPPFIELGGDVANPNFATSYTTGNLAGVAIGAANAVLDDPDTNGIHARIENLTAHITNPLSNDATTREFLVLTAVGHSILTSNPGLSIAGENTTTLTISGVSTDTVYQSLLREIHYVDTDQRPGSDYTTQRTVVVTAEDGAGGCRPECGWNLVARSPVTRGYRFRRQGQLADR